MFYTTGTSYIGGINPLPLLSVPLSHAQHSIVAYGCLSCLGTVAGGIFGIIEGLRHPAATSNRLRVNTVLNAVQKRGPFLGNTLGVISAFDDIALGNGMEN
jgi:import inner membrane translocase subunit TIM23